MWRFVVIAFVLLLHVLQASSYDMYKTDHQDINVVEGHEFTYICTSPTILMRRIWWQKNTTMTSRFFTNGNILIFLNTSRQDAGTYSCIAEVVNEGILTNTTLAIIKLNVQYHQDINVVEGHEFTYICTSPSILTRRIWWQKNTTVTSRFFTNGNILIFLNTSRQDAGTYSCIAEVVNEGILTNTTLAVIILNVQYPAKVTQMWISAREIDQNRTFSVSCTVEGNPVDFTLLIVETQRTIVSGNLPASFTIYIEAKCIDEGTYACTARNFLNKENSTLSHKVIVWCPPQLDDEHRYPNMKYAKLGDNLTFDLSVWAEPQPEFTWFKAARWNHWLPTPIPSDRQNNSKLTTSLKIQNVGPSDFGNYTVMVKNRLGTMNSTFCLQPQGPPQAPFNLRVVQLTSTTVTLDWFIGYNYFEDFQTFAIQYSYEGLPFQPKAYVDCYSNQSVYHMNYPISYLSPSTQYFFRVYSYNRYGNSDYSNTVQFVTYGAEPRYENSLDTKMIAIISAAGGLTVAFLVLLTIWWIRKRRNYKSLK